MSRWRNWGRTVDVRPAVVARPATVEGLQEVVRRARERGLRVKAVGAGHSFTAIAEATDVQVDLSRMRGLRSIDRATGRVRFAAGTHLWEIPALLAPHGLALQNLGDIDRQTIAGATSTGTHGTGLRFGGLATQITGATLVTADAGVLTVSEREHAELLPAVRLGLGALGLLAELEVQCVPAFLLHAVEAPEGWDAVLDDLDRRAAEADHFEFYWWPHTDLVMTKTNTRLDPEAGRQPLGRLAGWLEDTVVSNAGLDLVCAIGHAAPGLTPGINRLATRAYGHREYVDDAHRVFVHPRTARFRESEYAVPRAALPEALRALRRLIDDRGWRISFPVEVRVAAADDNWLSTAYGRESGYIAVHRHVLDAPDPYLAEAGALLSSFDGRPHWGKLHREDAATLSAKYPRFADFAAVRERLDPDRRFANAYLDLVLGE